MMAWLKGKSLARRLVLLLSLSAVGIWFVSTATAWFQVRHEVNKVFDAQQILFAQRLASSDLTFILSEHHHSPSSEIRRHNFKQAKYDDDALAFAIFSADGKMLFSDGENGKNFSFKHAVGFSQDHIYDDDDEWRIFWQPIADGRLWIAVGQELEYREELVNEMVFSQMWVWLTGLLLLLVALPLLIRRELSALTQLGEAVRRRHPDDHSPIVQPHLPQEVVPLVQNLNQFFDRTSAMLIRERRFTSDAAHELRSPLAALRVQTEVIQLAGEDVAMREQALEHLLQGIDRASQLIEQLLTLSRLDNLACLADLQPLHWEQLISSLVSELHFSAQKRGMKIDFIRLETPPIRQGQPLLASLMLRNLIDNAVKYAREGASISIKLEKSHLIIEDNGGGIEPDALTKLGQRFYRPAGQNEKGSGLGLSIVLRIAELHHYRVTLENVQMAQQPIGFRAIIEFG